MNVRLSTFPRIITDRKNDTRRNISEYAAVPQYADLKIVYNQKIFGSRMMQNLDKREILQAFATSQYLKMMNL